MLQAGWLALSIGFWATVCQKTAIDDRVSPSDVTATAKVQAAAYWQSATDGYIYYDNLSVHKISN
jgi:hypothetical protein